MGTSSPSFSDCDGNLSVNAGLSPGAGNSPELCQAAFDSILDGVYLVDAERRILEWNSAAENITGYLRQDVVGRQCFDDLLDHCTLDGINACRNGCPLEATMRDGYPREMLCYLRHKEGHRLAVRVRASAVRRDGVIVGAVEVFEERDTRRWTPSLACRMENPSLLDPLTGLPNHALIEMRLVERVNEFPRFGIPFGLLLADIDKLDHINRAYGRDAGNHMLRMVAQALLGGVTEQQLLGRWNQDKFLVVIDGCDQATLRMVGERLRVMVEKSRIHWWGKEVGVTVSIGGVVVAPGETERDVIGRADKMLAVARAGGGNAIALS